MQTAGSSGLLLVLVFPATRRHRTEDNKLHSQINQKLRSLLVLRNTAGLHAYWDHHVEDCDDRSHNNHNKQTGSGDITTTLLAIVKASHYVPLDVTES